MAIIADPENVFYSPQEINWFRFNNNYICINNISLIAFVFHTDSGQLPPLDDEQHHNEYSEAVQGYYQHQGANWSAAGTNGRASSFWCAANGRNSISAYTFWDSQVGDPVQ